MILGKSRPILPLFIISLLMMGVAADLIGHYVNQVDTSGNVVADPFWTKFTDMSSVEVTTVPFPDTVQNGYSDTDHYLLTLVNTAGGEVEIGFEIIGTLSTGVSIECYQAIGDVLWEEGVMHTVLLGNGYPDFVEVYFRSHATYEAVPGPLGDFDLRFTTYEYQISPFQMDVDPATTSGLHPEDVSIVDSGDLITVLTAMDFGLITQGVPKEYTGAALVYTGAGSAVMDYAWTGMPADVTVVLEYSLDGGITWVIWNIGETFIIGNSPSTAHLRFTITSSADYRYGLTVSIDFSCA
jgi:hypothetical protein